MYRIIGVVAAAALVGGAVYVAKHKSEIREGLSSASDKAKASMQSAFGKLRKPEEAVS